VATAASAPAHMWFVKTGGEVWGPYPEARMAEFAREGRVRPSTLLSPFAQGPWSPAADSAEFAGQLRRLPPPPPQGRVGLSQIQAQSQPPARIQASPEPSRWQAADPAPAAAARPVEATPGLARPLLVFAQLTSVAPATFNAALARLGACAQVRPDLWLVRSSLGAAALRNLLSAHLTGGDSLLVVEAPLEQAAWFNLAPAHDRDLRRLWSGG
jgi:hypothetical protein